MRSEKIFSDALAKAYSKAEYRVFTANGALLLPAQGHSAELAELHNSYGVSTSVLITAYNPYSEKTDEATNLENHQRLISEVSRRWKYLQAESVDSAGQWPTEPGLLVLGMNLQEALKLGRKFHQYALLFAEHDRIKLYACEPENQLFIHRIE